MSIAVGQKLPDATFKIMQEGKAIEVSTRDFFAGKTVALFAVPGAYTPTCHNQHVPSFLGDADKLAAAGIDVIACTSVNDVFVLDQWAKDTGAAGKIAFLADGSADFARAIGMELDLGGFGLGVRSKRYAMLVKDGVVAALNVEDNAGECTVSSAPGLLKAL